MDRKPTKQDQLVQRVEKLEIAVVMLLNCLRATKQLDNGVSVVPQLPGPLLDKIERMVLTSL
jgi:hypothetical protein